MAARVRNWKKFQHFTDRRPSWIKVYRDLLDDPDWHELSGDEAKALVMIWLVASEYDGDLPDTRKLAFRLRTGERELEKLLRRLSHWLERDDAEALSFREALESVAQLAKQDPVKEDERSSHVSMTVTAREYPDASCAAGELDQSPPQVNPDCGSIAADDAAKGRQNAVRVTRGTPQWDAWLAYYANRNKLTHRLMSEAGDFNLHFLVPSEYPPSDT
jgi:hypothetical protein